MLRIYDTAAREKVDFVPRREGTVSIYVCGPTPYDVPHIGHGRTAVVFDTVRRYFQWLGVHVTFVNNVTDVEDRIIARAAERGTTESELAQHYEVIWFDTMARMAVQQPDEMPRATEFIPQMQKLIAELVAAGRAYVIEGEGVYFQVDTLPSYGQLSHRKLDELVESAGARIDVDAQKRSPVDFALWKAAKPGEPKWESPWGDGRPGWHIECSAMSLEILGEDFDIHGGGDDLVFPHHENEIAQSEGAGHPFARHWMHSGMVNAEGVKMSKSLNNFVTLGEVLDEFDPRAFRLLILQTHYRKQMEFGSKELADAVKAVERLDALARRAELAQLPDVPIGDTTAFRAAMEDDFDTPGSVAVVFDLVRRANTALDAGDHGGAAVVYATVRELAGALGIELHADTGAGGDDAELDDLVRQRDDARAAKDWAAADRIRDELQARGIVLEDTPHGTVWRRA